MTGRSKKNPTYARRVVQLHPKWDAELRKQWQSEVRLATFEKWLAVLLEDYAYRLVIAKKALKKAGW